MVPHSGGSVTQSHVSADEHLHEALQSSMVGTHSLQASPLGRVSAPSDTVLAGQVATGASCADASSGEMAARRSSESTDIRAKRNMVGEA